MSIALMSEIFLNGNTSVHCKTSMLLRKIVDCGETTQDLLYNSENDKIPVALNLNLGPIRESRYLRLFALHILIQAQLTILHVEVHGLMPLISPQNRYNIGMNRSCTEWEVGGIILQSIASGNSFPSKAL
jgi:hypothetical protein